MSAFPPHALQHIAIVGGGPVGLWAALMLAHALPASQISLFDSRAPDADLSRDRRTLALALGTTQLIEGLVPLASVATQAIARMQVSEATPLPWPLSAMSSAMTAASGGAAQLSLDAAEAGLPALGTVVAQGDLTAILQAAWQQAVAAEPKRLFTQLGQSVKAYRLLPQGVLELDGDVVHTASLLIVAEGLAAQALAASAVQAGAAEVAPGARAFAAKPLERVLATALASDYAQTAWVGTVELAASLAETAVQRFTPAGPLTLLPADAVHGPNMAAVVACVPSAHTPGGDPLVALDDAQRVAALNQWLGGAAQVTRIGYLKPYPLALTARKSLVNWGATSQDNSPARVLHIGAAAQTTYPLLASAIDMGLRDAHELSAKLADAGPEAAASSVDAALRRWELGRTPERWGLVALTDLAGRTSSVGVPGVGDVISGLRGAGLAALNAAGPVKRALVQQVVFGSRSA